jgi:hypothetical protein
LYFVTVSKSDDRSIQTLVTETLRIAQQSADSVSLTYREYRPNGWEPLPETARKALRELEQAGTPRRPDAMQWTIGVTPKSADLWDLLRTYIPHSVGVTASSMGQVIWRLQDDATSVSIFMSDVAAANLSEMSSGSLKVAIAANIDSRDAIKSDLLRGGSGLTRRAGERLRIALASSNGQAPWSVLAILAAAAILGAVLGVAIIGPLIPSREEPGVDGAFVGISGLVCYGAIALLVDWRARRRQSRGEW